jgi:hypothetical protein
MRKRVIHTGLIIGAVVVSFWLGFLVKSIFYTDVSKKTDKKIIKKTGPVKSKKQTGSGLTEQQKEKIKKLESIGYLSGYKSAGKKKNITKYNRKLAYNGLNLYVSAHAPEAILMDMNGRAIHKWTYKKPLYKSKKYSYGHFQKHHWRRVHLFENGDLLAIFEGLALLKLDKDSNLLWVYDEGPHHDIEVVEDGRIYVLTREAKIIPRLNKTEPILEDFITILTPEGKKIKRVSLLEAFENSYYFPLLKSWTKHSGDIFHTNTLEIFDGKLRARSSLFKKGNALISFRYLNAVAVVDIQKEKIIWCLTGMWKGQHQPVLLANSHMLLFDNNGINEYSRVLEFDPFSQHVYWCYKSKSPGGFYSSSSGSVQRLPNGNTLITESNSGRAFEVTPTNTIVWEFINPYRSWKNKKLVATLFEMIRLEPGFPVHWATKPGN